MEKILVIRFGSLGDIILSSATITNLRLHFPSAKIVYLTRERFRETVELINGVDEIVTIENNCSLSELFVFLVSLDRRNFSAVIDLHGNFRSWLARKMVTANKTVVYPKRRLERFRMTRKGHPSTIRPHTHTIDLYNKALIALGCTAHCKRPLLQTPKELSGDISQSSNRLTIAIAPGAAHDNKQFPLERFAELAKRLSLEDDISILWLLTKKDAERFETIGDRLVDRPIAELAGVISRCALTIANDSGIAHLSSSVGTPTLAIFGPTHPALGFAPAGLRDRVIESEQYCRPCSRHGGKPCYREERFCFNEISTDNLHSTAVCMARKQSLADKALFIDRDGTLLVNKHYLSDPEQVEFEPGAIEGIRLAQTKGFKIVIVSNQSGVARGYFTHEDLEKVNARMVEMLAEEKIVCDDIQYCPHYPVSPQRDDICGCRKPSPGMVEKAALRLNIDIRGSYVIGDSMADYHLAIVTGMTPLVVRTGHGNKTESILSKIGADSNMIVHDNLLSGIQSLF